MQSEIAQLFQPGVILSLKTIAQRSGIKRRNVNYTLKQMVSNDILKQCEPIDVGSGKHHMMLFSLK